MSRFETLEVRNVLSTFSVSSLDDSGPGTLRDAIELANLSAGADTIDFSVAGPISLLSDLPAINDVTGGTTVDGTTAPGYFGTPVIGLSGVGVGSGLIGITITSAQNAVRGLYMDLLDVAVLITGPDATDNIISSNFIGFFGGDGSSGIGATENGRGIIIDNAPRNLVGTNADGIDDEFEINLIAASQGPNLTIVGSLATENVVAGNIIGFNAPILNDGIFIDGAPGNIVGGTIAGTGNLVAGGPSAIHIAGAGAYDNRVQGNNISSGFAGDGVLIDAAGSNLIGGTLSEEGNDIHGNVNGIVIHDNGLIGVGSVVQGNNIQSNHHSDVTVENATNNRILNNEISTVYITDAASNIIGGAAPGEGNRIGSIHIAGNSASGNRIQGNYIRFGGVRITDAPDNLIGGAAPGEGNAILENPDGIYITGSGAFGNRIQGNTIVYNFESGVTVDAAGANLIGGLNPGERNTISANDFVGIRISGDGITGGGDVIQGNYIGIGIDPFGDELDGNGVGRPGVGILLENAPGTRIGGTDLGAGNVIAATIAGPGMRIRGESSGIVVQGNIIGTNATDSLAVGNERDGIDILQTQGSVLIGGTAPGAGNIISGNGRNSGVGAGLNIVNSDNVTVQGNYIGTDATGSYGIGNPDAGIVIQGNGFVEPLGNLIGGTDPGARNVISANGENGAWGVEIEGSGHTVQGNRIGTDASGTYAIPNVSGGISVDGEGNLIGGMMSGAGNLISGNLGHGIWIAGTGHVVQGNKIGTDITGTQALGNASQVDEAPAGIILNQAVNTQIGGTTPETGNLISGNSGYGIWAFGSSGFNGTKIEGNLIGTDASGAVPVGNSEGGVFLMDRNYFSGAVNTIGGTTLGAGNTISGNGGPGIHVSGEVGNVIIQGNRIGTDVTGAYAVGNFSEGILADLGGSVESVQYELVIGGLDAGAGNIVSGNISSGIDVSILEYLLPVFATVQGNYIGTDGTGTNAIANGGYGVIADVNLAYGVGDSSILIGGATPAAANYVSGVGGSNVSLVLGNNVELQNNYLLSPGFSGGLPIDAATQTNPSPEDTPTDVEFPVDFFSIAVYDIEPGGSTAVTVLLPLSVTADSYYKYGPTPDDPVSHWYEFIFDGTTGAEVFSDHIILHFADGQRGDDDLEANGVITDPGGPVRRIASSNEPPVAHDLAATVTEDGQVVIVLSGTDVETPESELLFTISSLPTEGQLLTEGGAMVQAGQTFSGPPTLKYEPGAAREGSGSDNFTYVVTDAGRVGGQLTDNASVTIDITKAVADGQATIDANGVVRVGGTSGNNNIVVTRSLFGSKLLVRIDGQLVSSSTPLSAVHEIRVWGRDGNDKISVLLLDMPTLLHGGPGSDEIIGGLGSNLIFGGAGADKLLGGIHNDLLVGGAGADIEIDALGDDVLVGGSVSSQLTDDFFRQLLANWAASQLQSVPFVQGLTDDAAIDSLFDSLGDDWFAVSNTDLAVDLNPFDNDLITTV